MHPKDADGMANSVDPDQTASSEAVWPWSALFAETYLSQYIEFFTVSWFPIQAFLELPIQGQLWRTASKGAVSFRYLNFSFICFICLFKK